MATIRLAGWGCIFGVLAAITEVMHFSPVLATTGSAPMLSDSLSARLRDFQREQLRRKPRSKPSPRVVAEGFTLAEQIAGIECESGSGTFFRTIRAVRDLCPALPEQQHLGPGPDAGDGLLHPELARLAQTLPQGAMFLDLETCGFAGSAVFLIGLIYTADASSPHAGHWVLDQLLARHYGEERAIFETLWSLVPQHQVLVTFNGKSFDWPTVRDRSNLHRLATSGSQGEPVFPQMHCDLLHHARRKWKGCFPNCKLQTLERNLCRRWRRGDIPGHLIPDAYHYFVRSGDARQLRSILHHNALDLLTLLELACKLTR